MEALRVAVAGTGFIGRVHARAARLAGAEVVGVAASSPASAARAAADLGVERAFASGEELAESSDVDVVHLCTPNHLHEPLALGALAAGKHVVCEKPVALDGAGARRIADAAAAAGRVVAVPFVYRFHPVVREARARVAAGELGRLRLLHGSYQQDWLLSPDDVNWRVDPALGGASRAFADIGSHWCDVVEFVSGHRIVRLQARTATTVPERAVVASAETFTATAPTSSAGAGAPPSRTLDTGGPPGATGVQSSADASADPPGGSERQPVTTEDVVLVLFETDAGGVGSLVVSQVSPGRKNRLWFELDGEAGSVVFDQEQPETLWLGRREGGITLPRDPTLLSPDAARLATLPAGHGQGYHDCFDLFVADAYRAMQGDVSPSPVVIPDGLPLVADGVRAARLTDAVLASARTQTWTEVPA